MANSKRCLLIMVSLISISQSAHIDGTTNDNNVDTCSLPDNLIKEIDSYEEIVNRIVNTAMHGLFQGFTWNELGRFVDKFGSRFEGTENLENSIDYMLENSKKQFLDNVHGEPARVPHWIRGSESATLLLPRVQNLAILGLGYSVGTPEGPITAPAVVVKSFDELKNRRNEIPGKIVIYNQDFESYEKTVVYRSQGASEAAKLGAVAVLIRSVTPVSIYTPHTGMLTYAENVTKIPAACITVEDAELLYRLQNRGETLKIRLKMDAEMLPEVQSRNLVAEITGNSKPEKVVIVSGHIDSWDVGQGAMDDGGGAFISWSSLVLLKKLNLRPKRTIRAILWTAEEMGSIGARQYIQSHEDEQKNIQFVMESDMGTFKPLGLVVSANDLVRCIVQRILSLLKPLGNLNIEKGMDGPDINFWLKIGIPGATLWNQNDKYFWYHHTNADTMLVEDSHSLDAGTALFAAVSYVIADISINMSRNVTK